MSALPKIHPEQARPVRTLANNNILGNPFLLDEKNFKKYNRIISDYIQLKESQRWHVIQQNVKDGILKYIPRPTIHEYINQLIKQSKLPHDYHQRHIMRLLAQGSYVKPDILEQYEIIVSLETVEKLVRRTPEHRQPNSPFDFVLIDPSKWGEYEPLQRFYKGLPDKPFASITKDGNALILPKDKAINLAYIQPCHPLYTHCIVFDIDEQAGRDGFTAWREYNLPPPNIIVKNPTKDSYHYIYLLALPVGKGGNSSKKPIIKLDHIYEQMRILLGADPSYAGARMKNPFSRKHDCFVSGAKPYTLDELADKLDFPDLDDLPKTKTAPKSHSKPVEPLSGYLGRNHQIFDIVRFTGYSNANMHIESLTYFLLSECEKINESLFSHDPLPAKELWTIADSIARFCKSAKFTYSPEVRQKRSAFAKANVAKANEQGACSKGGIARSATYTPKRTLAAELHSQGVSKAQIAVQLGVSSRTVINWLKG